MAGLDTPVAEKIREIIEQREDILHGWSDQEIAAEAARRARAGLDPQRAAAFAPVGTGDWSGVIAEIRSETDNDGQERSTRRQA